MIKEIILIAFLITMIILFFLIQNERNKEMKFAVTDENTEKLNKLILALKEYSKNHSDLASVLNKLGLL
jgi:hypothetical protein